MRRPGIPATVWFLAFVGVSYLYIEQFRKPQPSGNSNNIIFGEKFYYENPDEDAVYVTGTMTGPAIGYPNNIVGLTCYRDRNYCAYTSVHAIGANHIARMDPPNEYDIVKWDDDEIIAEDQSTVHCQKITITIDRKARQLAWVEEPINQTEASCVNPTTEIAKYTIESSPGWKRVYGEGK
jgi:hypothetical protein